MSNAIWCCELQDLNKFVETAKPNNKFTYYTGLCLMDTLLSKEIQKIVLKHAIKGEVYLVQQRKKDSFFYFDYLMIKASKPPIYKLVPFSAEQMSDFKNRNGRMRYHVKSAA